MSEIIRSPNAHRAMWASLTDKDYRKAYAVAHVADYLAMQIHSMRIRRGWTQKQLARESDNTQPQISKFETSCESINLSTLHKFAEAFDVALLVKFVPFNQLAHEAMNSRADQKIPSFDQDSSTAIGITEVRTFMPDSRASRRNGGDTPEPYHQFPPSMGTTVSSASLSRG